MLPDLPGFQKRFSPLETYKLTPTLQAFHTVEKTFSVLVCYEFELQS